MEPPVYSITISPPTVFCSVRHRLRILHDVIDPILRRIATSYILYPEFDSNKRLHFHGLLRGYDDIKYHLTKWKLDKIGFTKVDILKSQKDRLRFICYCQKEWRKTTLVLEKAGLFPDEYPLFKKTRRSRKTVIHSIGPPRSKSIYDFFPMIH